MAHDPTLEAKRREARLKGGKGKARTVRARKLLMAEFEVWDQLIDKAVDETYRGMLPPNVATAIASLAGAKVKFFETSIRLWELTEGQEKLDELAAKVEEMKFGNGIRNGHRVGGRNGI